MTFSVPQNLELFEQPFLSPFSLLLVQSTMEESKTSTDCLVLGMGNPLLDISAEVPQDILDKFFPFAPFFLPLLVSLTLLFSIYFILGTMFSLTMPFWPKRSTFLFTKSLWITLMFFLFSLSFFCSLFIPSCSLYHRSSTSLVALPKTVSE